MRAVLRPKQNSLLIRILNRGLLANSKFSYFSLHRTNFLSNANFMNFSSAKNSNGSDTNQKPKTIETIKNPYEVFVGNLPWKAKEEEILEYFKQCGTPTLTKSWVRPNGKTEGFTYIQFKDDTEVKAALNLNGASFMNRPLRITEPTYNPKTMSTLDRHIEKQKKLDSNVLFVESLPKHATKKTINQFFVRMGKIKDIRLKNDKNGYFKGSAFVEFSKSEEAAAALELSRELFDGKRLKIAIDLKRKTIIDKNETEKLIK
ncbi:unnamed protein product [Blepharisma stoltei]|uniref:RRM domain-containing protein n=1 Tax=Blepharisma stoltei TaxID=1481888 RepID=A0AAU9IUF4_9CILI|nr:unnamed protein product [Blepharisma stoltei]